MKKLTAMFRTIDNKTAYKSTPFKTETDKITARNLLIATHSRMQYVGESITEIKGVKL